MKRAGAVPRPSGEPDANGANQNEDIVLDVFPILNDIARADRQLIPLCRQLDRMKANYNQRKTDVAALKLIAVRLNELSSEAAVVFV